MEGFITLNRKLFASDLWTKEKFTKGQAWVDLIFMANYAPSKSISGVRNIDIDRGQILTSILSLSNRWKWSLNKVSNLLKFLEETKAIRKQTENKFTIITICNYDIYQLGNDDIHKQTETSKEGKVKKKKNNTPLPHPDLIYPFEGEYFKKCWIRWIEYKWVQHNDKYKELKSEQAAINKLAKLADNDLETAVEIMKISVVNLWRGLFAIKNQQQSTEQPPHTFVA